jgi:pimeloyl-ACP methyl ester carboxylesterase
MTLWVERGGTGDEVVVLLHGLGATAAVWRGVAARISAGGRRWIAPDLRGHGRSHPGAPFGYGMHAADIAALIAPEDPARVTLLGHSFGGVVAAVAASGLFGPVPARVIALGVKTDWTEAEVEAARALAARPARIFATRAEAAARHLKVAGLEAHVAPDAPEAEGGVHATGQGWALAMDPRVYAAVGPQVPDLMAACRAPLRMVAGADDPMASLATMRSLDPAAHLLPGQPHNAHVADPDAVARLIG